MNPRTWHGAGLLSVALCLGWLTGCVERRFVITTNPPEAMVYDEKHMPLGASPTDRQFVYYGKYQFTIVRDGYETLVVTENVKAPWYEWFGLDFFSEAVPYWFRDVRRLHYDLKPAPVVPAEEILEKAKQMRTKGQAIGVPLPPAEPAAIEGPPPRALPQPNP